jgi:release factor glutamine methyltransferase
MTTDTWLRHAQTRLTAAGIGTARLDSLILLEDATGLDRTKLLAMPDTPLPEGTIKILNGRLERRAGHEPIAYIRGKTEFFGREFEITPDVLEPRPETETMIELLQAQHLPAEIIIWDVGTGSGAIAITAKLELPRARVIASDINDACLRVAGRNARKLGATVSFFAADLLEAARPHPAAQVLLCNLPYVPDAYTINEAALKEPRQAIFGGPDGLSLYRKLFSQAAGLDPAPSFILTESLPFQHAELQEIARTYKYGQSAKSDFIQIFTRQ